MKYGIFKIGQDKNAGPLTVTFTALANPAEPKKVLSFDAENSELATNKAAELLKTFGIKITTLLGDSDTVTADFPDYFVGELRDDWNGHSSIIFRVHNFVPIRK